MPVRSFGSRFRRTALVAVNLLLLAHLAGVLELPTAEAQNGRARGKYLAVSGGVAGSESDAVWIVDTVNREMVTLTWDPNRKEILGIGYRDLDADAAVRVQAGDR